MSGWEVLRLPLKCFSLHMIHRIKGERTEKYMHPILFSIGNMNIYGYGTCIALGMIAATVFGCTRAKKHNIDPDLIFTAGFAGIVAGVIGAKVFYWLVELDEIIKDPKLLLSLDGGFVFYGGIIFGVLVPFIYIKVIKKQTFLDKLDMAIPAVSLAQAFGRIGCFMAGCCYGQHADHAWYTVVFPENAYCSAPAGVDLIPTQLLSSCGDLLLFFLLWLISNKEKFRGEATAFYMLFYSVGRFLIEFLRGDAERGTVGIFSTSQFISLFIFAGGLALLIICAVKKLSPFGSRELKQDRPFVKGASDEAAEETAEDKADEGQADQEKADEEQKEETVKPEE